MTTLRPALGAKHIVWDWNGTLLDDNHAVLDSVNAVCAGFGREPLTMDEWRSTFSRPLIACYERVLRRSLTMEDWAEVDRLYHDAYRAVLHTCDLAVGARELLLGWQASGRSQSLLSMWFHTELVPLVTQFELAELFARIDGLVVETGGGSKAEHLVAHLAALDLDPVDTVLIGDVVDDAVAADQAGTHCILVTTGVMTRTALETTGRPVVDSMAEALELLREDTTAPAQ